MIVSQVCAGVSCMGQIHTIQTVHLDTQPLGKTQQYWDDLKIFWRKGTSLEYAGHEQIINV